MVGSVVVVVDDVAGAQPVVDAKPEQLKGRRPQQKPEPPGDRFAAAGSCEFRKLSTNANKRIGRRRRGGRHRGGLRGLMFGELITPSTPLSTCPGHKVRDFRFLSIRDGRDLIKL